MPVKYEVEELEATTREAEKRVLAQCLEKLVALANKNNYSYTSDDIIVKKNTDNIQVVIIPFSSGSKTGSMEDDMILRAGFTGLIKGLSEAAASEEGKAKSAGWVFSSILLFETTKDLAAALNAGIKLRKDEIDHSQLGFSVGR